MPRAWWRCTTVCGRWCRGRWWNAPTPPLPPTPPLLLPFSVFFAIRDAVSAAGGHRADPPLRAPATAEAILDAISAVQ